MIKGKNLLTVCTCYHDLTGVEQCITSAYYRQSNSLVKIQNWMIKNALVKLMEKSGRISSKVFFCASRKSTFVNKIPTISFFYNRDPVLPINVKFSLEGSECKRSIRWRNFLGNSCIRYMYTWRNSWNYN